MFTFRQNPTILVNKNKPFLFYIIPQPQNPFIIFTAYFS